jgi:hypothetical protein
MMPGITIDMMERLINIDFSEMDSFTQKVIAAMEDADDVVIENPDGTYLECSVKGRKWKADNGDISQIGSHGNLPAGECFTAPVEESFTGKLVISLIDDKLGHGEISAMTRQERSSGNSASAQIPAQRSAPICLRQRRLSALPILPSATLTVSAQIQAPIIMMPSLTRLLSRPKAGLLSKTDNI